MNTVKSKHTVSDVRAVRASLRTARLLVRVNSVYEDSAREIDAVIAGGADIVMLPYFKTVQEVAAFLAFCGGRVRTRLLVETAQAVEHLEEILALPGIDDIYIGLNDLHLSLGKKFMFELLTDGTVDHICRVAHAHGVPFGIGGVASIGKGMLPAEYILAEHYRLGSSAVILSRSFCNIAECTDLPQIRRTFIDGVAAVRAYETKLSGMDDAFFDASHRETARIIRTITEAAI